MYVHWIDACNPEVEPWCQAWTPVVKLLFSSFLKYMYMSHLLLPRLYGTKCAGCNVGLCPEDLVRRAVNKVYHVHCFLCSLCKKTLSTGEQLYLVQVGYEEGGRERYLYMYHLLYLKEKLCLCAWLYQLHYLTYMYYCVNAQFSLCSVLCDVDVFRSGPSENYTYSTVI